jgi:ABC-type antimicrobial peptide transport system permease subunit
MLSVGLTVLGGWIPAKMAANKDAVEALRIE